MKGKLKVENKIIGVVVDKNFYPLLSNATLSTHCDGSYNINMTLNSIYTSYKEGTEVSGILSRDGKSFINI